MAAFERERAQLLAEQEDLQRALREERQQHQQHQHQQRRREQEPEGEGGEVGEWEASGSFGVDPLLVEATAEEARRCVLACIRACRTRCGGSVSVVTDDGLAYASTFIHSPGTGRWPAWRRRGGRRRARWGRSARSWTGRSR